MRAYEYKSAPNSVKLEQLSILCHYTGIALSTHLIGLFNAEQGYWVRGIGLGLLG